MCGISGFNWNDEGLIRAMTDSIEHRGPDQQGHFCSDEMSLGFRRLSIIDLSDNGRQPMFNEDKTIALVFNGEIYNFQELRKELKAKGHVFGSKADSEVIIHGYEEWGTEVMQRLRGMFAFGLYDIPRKRLLLVRDRIGIKPLYYTYKEGRLLFASEIKAILEDKQVERRINYQAMYDYLALSSYQRPRPCLPISTSCLLGICWSLKTAISTRNSIGILNFIRVKISSLLTKRSKRCVNC
ncbi:hypothetical protein VU11_04385 [Desulfobulbus sp. US2]|nr:hypothetical protein [Desulfobulbus sp. US2]